MAWPLLQLPPELLEAIATATDGDQLLFLRLTCREMCRIVDKVFINRYFTTRRHLVTKESFQTLIDISKNPRLRRKLKTIDLIVTNLASVTDTPTIRRPQKTADASLPHPMGPRPQSIWSSWCHEAEDITKDRMDVSMLSEALSNLHDARVYPELKVSTHTHLSPTPYGFHRLVQQLDSTKRMCSRNEYVLLGRCPNDNSETTWLLLAAIARSRFPVKSLDLSDRRSPLHPSVMSSLMRSSRLKSVWSRLETLSASPGCLHKSSARQIAAMCDFNRSAFSRLQELRLVFNSRCCKAEETFLHPHMLTPLVATELKTIHLTGAVLRSQDLCGFLAQHKDSLRNVVLRHVVLGPHDKFAAVFEWMNAELSLDSLVLHWLRQGHDHMDERSGRGAEYVYSSKEEVKSGLRELARSATFGDPPPCMAQCEQ